MGTFQQNKNRTAFPVQCPGNLKSKLFLLINGLAGLVLLTLITLVPVTDKPEHQARLLTAAKTMQDALNDIQNYCADNLINTDNPADPWHTGLVGPEWSEITTTVGDPEAKRTTLNPNFAALIAHLLLEAGVKSGDTIAIGSSGSFPALFIASLSAAKALQLHPRVILSLGSSSYGASNLDFTLWDLHRILMENGLVTDNPVAASLGGDDDTGAGFEPAILSRLTENLTQSGIPLIAEQDLQKNCSVRYEFYTQPGTSPPLSSPRKRGPAREPTTLMRKRGPAREPATSITAFINCGGALANIGSSPMALKIRPGLVRRAPMPEPGKQGMIHRMLQKEIPVIHLLYIKGLAQKYHLPWDPPVPPEITDESVRMGGRNRPMMLALSLITILWFLGFLTLFHMLYNRKE